MRKFVIIALFIILLLILSTCHYFELINYKEWLESTDHTGVDVYAAGYNADSPYACYWKNGKLYPLSGPSNTWAYSIYIQNSNIYICGMYNSGGNNFPCYWKNNRFKTLDIPSGYTAGFANNIIVYNSDIYIAGSYEDGGGNKYACYWKNGNLVDLSYGATTSELRSICGHNNSIYAVGHYDDIATYWRNNQRITFESVESAATSLSFYGEDLYIAGRINPFPSNVAVWKNGNLIYEYSVNSSFNSVVINNGDIHAGGWRDPTNTDDFPIYLKNNDLATLPRPGVNTTVSKIKVFDDDVYIAGHGSNAGIDRPCIWFSKNNYTLEYLEEVPVGDSHRAYDIFIVRDIVK